MTTAFRLSTYRALEREEQAALFHWAHIEEQRDPRLKLLNASQNGLKTSLHRAVWAKKCGMKKGYPDVSFPLPAHGYHGLYIELKRKGATPACVTPEQYAWLNLLTAYGHYATVAYGWEQAVKIIHAYLEQPPMTADLIAEYDYSLEPLMHYRHRSCPASSNNWWTISGGPSNSDLYCPNCGQRLSPAQYEPPAHKPAPPAQELDL